MEMGDKLLRFNRFNGGYAMKQTFNQYTLPDLCSQVEQELYIMIIWIVNIYNEKCAYRLATQKEKIL